MDVSVDDALTAQTPAAPEADTPDGFDRPWNPWWLVVFTLLFGLPGGGGLLAFNYRYLGMPGRLGKAMLGVLAASLAIPCVIQWMAMSGVIVYRGPDSLRGLRWAGQVVSVAIAAWMASGQSARWRQFRATGRPRGKLLIPGILAAIVSLVLLALLGNGAALLFAVLYKVVTIS